MTTPSSDMRSLKPARSKTSMTKRPPRLDQLPLDVLFEVLAHFSVPEILRFREVCHRLDAATRCKPVWVNLWTRSGLVLPEALFATKTADELETCVVRASKVQRNLVSHNPTNYTRRVFPRQLPTYEFDANMLGGRYLQLAERSGLSWYDLDGDDLATPVLSYSCPHVIPMEGYLNHQQDANSEGMGTYWVTFISTQPYQLNILKIELSPQRRAAKLHTTIPLTHPAPVRIAHDWVLLPKEFPAADDFSPLPVFHIPSQTFYKIPVHEEITDISDLCNTHYVITPRHILLMSSLRSETLVNVFPLPSVPISSTSSSGRSVSMSSSATKRALARSHRGVYPHTLSSIRLVETRRKHVYTPESPDSPYSSPSPSSSTPSSLPSPSSSTTSSSPSTLKLLPVENVSLLGLVYLAPSPLVQTWTSKIGLHLVDLCLHPNGAIVFNTLCSRTLDVGIMTTSLSLTASTNSCLAMTHSTPGPFLIAHHLKTDPDSGTATMKSKVLKLPTGLNSRTMVSFDGYTGRVCLLNGWTYLEILDYSDYDLEL